MYRQGEIYVAAVEALRKKERDSLLPKWSFSEFQPPSNANVLFYRFFLDLTHVLAKLRILVLCFPYFTDNSNTFNLSDVCSSLGCSKVSILLRLFNVISHLKYGKWNECFCQVCLCNWKQHMKLYFLIARLIELWSFVICKNNREIEDVLVHQQVPYSTLAIKLLSRC